LEGHDSPKTKQYPLSFINSHSRFSAHSQHGNLPWIKEICPEPFVEINLLDAEARGIKDGDMVTLFNDRGSCTLKAKVTEGIMPSVVNVYEAYWRSQFEQGHYADLTHYTLNPVHEFYSETNFAPYDILVEVKKA
jgi:anaerobic selenocysteine-containing dehydrogenase